tara:strand:+ start:23355 stop:23735 length:381 start_codon:yes stop_codon:yes gene_type:complete
MFSLIIAQVATTAATGVNLTLLFSVITVCVGLVTAAIKIFGPKKNVRDEELRQSGYLKELSKKTENSDKKIDNLKEKMTEATIEIEKLKIESKNNTKSSDELRESNKEMVKKLDELLKQMIDYYNN